MAKRESRRMTAVAAARFAFGFAAHNPASMIRTAAFPALAAALVLYLSLRGYLSELTAFISSGDARAASLALGALATAILGCLFIVAVMVSAWSELAVSARPNRTWLQFRAGRPAWRLYAAYLRLLLVMAGYVAAIYLISVYVLPQFTGSAAAIGLISATAILSGCCLLLARIGFLIAPIVAQSTGSVLRKALLAGSGDMMRNLAVIWLLSTPGILIEICGEYLFRRGARPARVEITLPLTAYARALENRLAEFVFVSTIAIVVTVLLITAASIACYRNRVFADAATPQQRPAVPTLDSAPV